MPTIRQANERGHFKNSWLNSHHSFSFGEYYDPEHMGVSVLRVINDDQITPGAGFPTHPHNNMEIVTYVLDGELAHKDSMGNGSVIRPGDVQRMSAGSGITHSEFNPSASNGTHLLQIWLLPNQQNIKPGYEQQFFTPESRQGKLTLLLSSDGRDGSLSANTDALMYGTLLDNNQTVSHQLAADRIGYLHLAKGTAAIGEHTLKAGDALIFEAGSSIDISGRSDTEVLLFDLPRQALYV